LGLGFSFKSIDQRINVARIAAVRQCEYLLAYTLCYLPRKLLITHAGYFPPVSGTGHRHLSHVFRIAASNCRPVTYDLDIDISVRPDDHERERDVSNSFGFPTYKLWHLRPDDFLDRRNKRRRSGHDPRDDIRCHAAAVKLDRFFHDLRQHRVNDRVRERQTLNDALEADPALSEDPSFSIWYQRLTEMDAREQSTREIKEKLDKQTRENPRRTKRWGIGFDLASGRGIATVVATAVVAKMVFPRIAIDAVGPGLDASVVIAPFPSRWSPFVGIGGHLSFAEMGLGDPSDGEIGMNNTRYGYAEMYGRQFRGEAGAQFVSRAGFTTELGLAMLVFDDREGKRMTAIMPILHFGWLW